LWLLHVYQSSVQYEAAGLAGVVEMIEQEIVNLTESSLAQNGDDSITQQHASDILDSSKFDLKLDKSNILMLGPTGSGECAVYCMCFVLPQLSLCSVQLAFFASASSCPHATESHSDVLEYLSSTDLIPPLQSGYRLGHSTETAVLRVLSDILQAVDNGGLAALVLLDMSAAFDTVDRSILLRRLHLTFSIDDTAHGWFQSYLSSRKQYVRRGPSKSSVTSLVCGVPQGSILGPILFVLYTVDLLMVIESHRLSPHMYADDTQVYGSYHPSAVTTFTTKVSECVEATTSYI